MLITISKNYLNFLSKDYRGAFVFHLTLDEVIVVGMFGLHWGLFITFNTKDHGAIALVI